MVNQTNRLQIEKEMTPAQIQKALTLAKNFKPVIEKLAELSSTKPESSDDDKKPTCPWDQREIVCPPPPSAKMERSLIKGAALGVSVPEMTAALEKL